MTTEKFGQGHDRNDENAGDGCNGECDTSWMEAIYRDDGELCGFVTAQSAEWHALTVFGGLLGPAATERAAEQIVREEGLPALAERWLLVTPSQTEEQIVCIQEASPEGVTLALDYYSMPGVATIHITRAEIDNGDCQLRRGR